MGAGALPPGLTLDASTGIVSGTPTLAGDVPVTFVATDSVGCAGALATTLRVRPAGDYLLGEGLGASNGNLARLVTRDGVATSVQFPAYAAGSWGTTVAAGSIDGSPHDRILTGPGPGPAHGPQVRAFDRAGAAVAKVNFYAYGTLRYGTNVGAADVDGDGIQVILTGPGPGAVFGPHVRGFDAEGGSVIPVATMSFFAYGTLRYGVNVDEGDVDADARAELLTGPGPGTIFGPHVRGWNHDGGTVSAISTLSFSAFAMAGFGANVAGGDVDGDGVAEIAVAPGPGPTHPSLLRGFDHDASGIAAIAGIDDDLFPTRYGGRTATADLRFEGRELLVSGLGRDPSAAAVVLAHRYDGVDLVPVVGTPFTAFGGAFGVNVAGGEFGYF